MSSDTPGTVTYADGSGDHVDPHTQSADVEELLHGLNELTDEVESPAAHETIESLSALITEAHERGILESGVRRLQTSDAVEAFIGSVIFASPLLVEDGVFDIARYLFGFTVLTVPVFLIANTLFVVTMTYALVEWTGRDKDETQVIAGVIPLRVVMILVISFLVAAGLMTVWGRLGDWQPVSEAVARINVVWTVGSLGAALGDIISDGTGATAEPSPMPAEQPDGQAAVPDPQRGHATDRQGPPDGLTDGALLRTIHEQFVRLERTVTDTDDRIDIQRLRVRTDHAALVDGFGDRIQKYTTRDVAEAFVGSIFFSIPFLVEDGVFDVAEYFLSFRVGQFPVFFLVNAAFVLLMVTALVYWAGPQDVRMTRPIFGVVPRRLIGIAVVSLLTVAALMTMWGRVDNWQSPVVAIARISVVWTVASFGAALGDILPGESSGDDINDEFADFGDRVEEFVE